MAKAFKCDNCLELYEETPAYKGDRIEICSTGRIVTNKGIVLFAFTRMIDNFRLAKNAIWDSIKHLFYLDLVGE